MTTITPEQFMTLTEPDEEEFEREALTEWAAEDPLASITQALQRIEARLDGQVVEAVLSDTVREQFDDLKADHETLYELLEEIEEIIKPSTSKLANSVREAITRWRAPEVPAEAEPEPPSDQPAHDADVEEWRLYARSRGYTVGEMNRSQIRTMLGIEQPAEVTV